jgi:cation transport ATPase
MKKTLILLIVCLVGFTVRSEAQKQNKNRAEISIQTSAKCGMCKDRLEKEMAYTPGVKSSVLNLDDKKLTIVYNPKKTSPEKLRKVISMVGYDADDVPADKNAHDALPPCCQKSAEEHD